MRFKGFICFLGVLSISISALAIVGPIEGLIPKDHPASYNTIALVKKAGGERYTIFCSGVIITSNMIMTAKHCLGERKLNEFWIYFGDNTNQVDPRLLRTPVEMSVYGPTDWESYFPSFDFGWVKIDGTIPNQNGENPDLPHFRPLPILTDVSWLERAEGVYLAGYGNQSTEFMNVVAGEKKHVATRFKKYINTSQLASLVMFEGDKGHSNCHGDSGGPAYVSIRQSNGRREWYVFGTAAGFDLALTPASYKKTNDSLFPHIAYCDSAQTLYTFAGDYVNWLEHTTGQTILKSSASSVVEPGMIAKDTQVMDSFQDWCRNANFKESQWLTVRHLLVYAMENTQGVHSEADIFIDCEKAEEALAHVDRIIFKENSRFGGLEPLVFLSTLRTLEFNKTPMPDLQPLLYSAVETLKLTGLEAKTLSDIPGLLDMAYLTGLEIYNSSLESLDGLQNFRELQKINVWENEIQSLEPLRYLSELTHVNFGNNRVEDMSALYGLSRLQVLVGSNNRLVSTPAPDGTWTQLKEVYLINNQLTDVEFLRDAHQIQRKNLKGNPLPMEIL